MPEVYGIRLPPPAARLSAPNFSLIPRSAAPPLPSPDAPLQLDQGGATTGGESDDDDDGLFGDDDDDEDDDEEMEDVTAGGFGLGDGSGGGEKRKAESDEEYDS